MLIVVARLIVAVKIYSYSEENSDTVTFNRLEIVEKKIAKSKADVMFKEAVEMFKNIERTHQY